jgi:hypothetical protein
VYEFESGQWFSLTLQLPRFGLDATSIANKIIFGGGHFIDPTDTIDIFNLSGSVFSTSNFVEEKTELLH